jgi:hypothetical protein
MQVDYIVVWQAAPRITPVNRAVVAEILQASRGNNAIAV